MDTFRLAVKGFIVDGDELFILQRSPDDVQQPGIWELPGGRLEPGEDPRDGLRREVREEAGLSVQPHEPLTVRHFERDDGQTITMIIFHCSTEGRDHALSEEHVDADWVPVREAEDRLNTFFHQEVQVFRDRQP